MCIVKNMSRHLWMMTCRFIICTRCATVLASVDSGEAISADNKACVCNVNSKTCHGMFILKLGFIIF